LAQIHDAILGHSFKSILTPAFWGKLPGLAGTVIGPARLFYLDSAPTDWAAAPPRGMTVRGLSAIDAKPFAEFIESLEPLEREHSGLELTPRPLWGAFKGKELLAVAGYDAWPGRIAHIGVAVHPAHRGKKLGQLVVQAAARGALARRRIVQYRALSENVASVKLAEALHFVPFAETLYIRPQSTD
jgi:RimJ/RimL family protein N-acetyltransferase